MNHVHILKCSRYKPYKHILSSLALTLKLRSFASNVVSAVRNHPDIYTPYAISMQNMNHLHQSMYEILPLRVIQPEFNCLTLTFDSRTISGKQIISCHRPTSGKQCIKYENNYSLWVHASSYENSFIDTTAMTTHNG